jgi:hypothetical protein
MASGELSIKSAFFNVSKFLFSFSSIGSGALTLSSEEKISGSAGSADGVTCVAMVSLLTHFFFLCLQAWAGVTSMATANKPIVNFWKNLTTKPLWQDGRVEQSATPETIFINDFKKNNRMIDITLATKH